MHTIIQRDRLGHQNASKIEKSESTGYISRLRSDFYLDKERTHRILTKKVILQHALFDVKY